MDGVTFLLLAEDDNHHVAKTKLSRGSIGVTCYGIADIRPCNGVRLVPLLASFSAGRHVGCDGHHGDEAMIRLHLAQRGSPGMLYRERQRGLRLEIELEADALITNSGADAYSTACRRAIEASSDEMVDDWSRVAAAIGRRKAKGLSRSPAKAKPFRPIDPVAELAEPALHQGEADAT